MTQPVETPCINVCTLDRTKRLCTGCGRTVVEIAGWAAMPPSERRAIMDRLARR